MLLNFSPPLFSTFRREKGVFGMFRLMRIVAITLGLLVSLHSVHADALFPLLGIEGMGLVKRSSSVQSRRDRDVIFQTSEVTCGPAALATLIQYYLGGKATEQEMTTLTKTLEKGTTTLLSLRDAAKTKGYNAVGYKMTLPQLEQQANISNIPVLVHFAEPQLHYALFVGRIGEWVLICDPALGNVTMEVEEFMEKWDGIALVVTPPQLAPSPRAGEQKRSAAKRLETLTTAKRMSALRVHP